MNCRNAGNGYSNGTAGFVQEIRLERRQEKNKMGRADKRREKKEIKRTRKRYENISQ
jgi:hypothetical protein